MEWIKHMLTGKDNETYDLGKLLWALGVLVFLFLSVWAFIKGAVWDGVLFGTGFGVVLMAGAGSTKLKASTEPEPKP